MSKLLSTNYILSQENYVLSFQTNNLALYHQHLTLSLNLVAALVYADMFWFAFLVQKDLTFTSQAVLGHSLLSWTWWQTQRCLKPCFYPVLMSYVLNLLSGSYKFQEFLLLQSIQY